MSNTAAEFHYFSSQLRKSNVKVSILFFFFLLLSFFFSIMHNSKVYGIYKRSTHQTTALLQEIFLFLVMAACKLRWTSYGPKHVLRWFPRCLFVCNYTHNFKTKGHIRMFYLLYDCSTIRDTYSLG